MLFRASGPVARSSGIRLDNRLSNNCFYGYYNNISLRSYVSTHGDSFDRFILRVREMFESSRIISNMLAELYNSNTTACYNMCAYNNTSRSNMVSIINLFRLVNGDFFVQSAIVYSCVESGKGEFGIHLVTNEGSKPYRIHVRSPAYMHLQLLGIIGTGHHVADLATLLGSLDIVFGEVDR